MNDQSLQRRRVILGVLSVIVAMSAQPARCSAQEIKDVHAGYELASKICSPCHLVGPLPGPSFMDIAKGEYGSPASL